MEVKAMEAFYCARNSYKQILKTRQKNLYSIALETLNSTLDVLTLVYKAHSVSIADLKIQNDEFHKFWLNDVLPLLFDDDHVIQKKTLDFFNQSFKLLDIKKLHESAQWSTVWKNEIMNYFKEIKKLREKNNKLWYRIWCFLIQILDTEILEDTDRMYEILHIMELGCRSVNNSTVIRSFHCWRCLIDTYHKLNKLTMHLRILNIPFNSAVPTSLEVIQINCRVWWHLIVQLCNTNDISNNSDNIKEFIEPVIESFLLFCYGVTNTTTIAENCYACAVEQYAELKEFACLCLTLLLSKQRNDDLQRYLYIFELESINLIVSSSLLDTNQLNKYVRVLAESAMKALHLYSRLNDSTIEIQTENNEDTLEPLYHQLLKNLMYLTLHQINDSDLLYYIFSEFIAMLRDGNQTKRLYVKCALDILATEGLTLENFVNSGLKYVKIIKTFFALMGQSLHIIPKNILDLCIKHFLQEIDLKKNWESFVKAIDDIYFTLQEEQQDDYFTFECNLLIWSEISSILIKYFDENPTELREHGKESFIERWLLWPLKFGIDFTESKNENGQNVYFNTKLYCSWSQLLQLGQHSPNRKEFLLKIHTHLMNLINNRLQLPYVYCEFFNAYAEGVIQLISSINHDTSTTQSKIKCHNKYYQLYTLVEVMLQMCVKASPTKNTKALTSSLKEIVEKCLHILLRTIMTHFTTTDIEETKNNLKAVIIFMKKMITPTTSLVVLDDVVWTQWRREILKKMRYHPNKNLSGEICNLFKVRKKNNNKNDDDVLKTIWSLRPEKLTEHPSSQSLEDIVNSRLPNSTVIPIQEQNKAGSTIGNNCNMLSIDNNQETRRQVEEAKKSNVHNEKSDVAININDETNKTLNRSKTSVYNDSQTKKRKNTKRMTLNRSTKIIKADNVPHTIKRKSNRHSDGCTLESDCPNKDINGFHIIKSKSQNKQPTNAITTITGVTTKAIEKNNEESKTLNEQSTIMCQAVDEQEKTTEHVKLTKESSKMVNDNENSFNPNYEININGNAIITRVFQNCDDSVDKTMTALPTTETKEVELAPKKNQNVSKGEYNIRNDNMEERTTEKTTPKFWYSASHRKLINNRASRIQSKSCLIKKSETTTTTHLTGRGAQLINMVRNRKSETASMMSPSTSTQVAMVLNKKNKENEMALNVECDPTNAIQSQQRSAQSTIAATSSAVVADGSVSAETDLPQFSKSLLPSPSVGILKRKLKQDSSSERLLEGTPTSKRKRVSFHDSISITYEHLIDTDEKRSENISSSTQGNNKLRSSSILSPSSSSSLEALRSHNNLDKPKHPNNDATNNNTKDHKQNQIRDQSVSTIKLNEAMNNFFSLDDLTKNKFLSNVMKEYANYRRIIFELATVNHFKDYIDHCIQENSDSGAAKKILLQNMVKQCTSNNTNEYNEICEHLLNGCTDLTNEWIAKFIEVIVA